MQPNERFTSRLASLRSTLGLSDAPTTAAAILVGAADDGVPENQKGVAMNIHLFDQPAAIDSSLIIVQGDTVRIFTEKSNEHFDAAAADPSVTVHAWGKADSQATLKDKLSGVTEFLVVKKELALQNGSLAAAFREFLELHHPSSTTDAAPKFTQALSVKDSGAIDAVRKAASYASTIMKSYVLPTLEETMVQDEDEPPYLASALAANIERTISNPTSIRGLENAKVGVYGIALAPVRLHLGGGKINMLCEESVLPRDKPLRPEAIAVSYAVRYKGYAAYIARTLLYNCDDAHKEAYGALVVLMTHFTARLVHGAVISEQWTAAREWFSQEYPSFAPHLAASGGFGLGLEMLSSISWLSQKNQRPLQAGMTFAVRLALEDIENANSPFSIVLADTFLVGADGASGEVLTSSAPFELEDVSRKVSLHSATQAIKEESEDEQPGRRHTRSSNRVNKGNHLQLEQARKALQDEILQKKKAELQNKDRSQPLGDSDVSELARLARGEINLNLPGGTAAELQAFYARHLAAQTPSVHAYYSIILDTEREILVLPNLNGKNSLSVLHLCTIKNAEVKSEQAERSLAKRAPSLIFRLQLHAATDTNAAFRLHPKATFLKELAYRIAFDVDADAAAGNAHVIVQNMQNLVALIKRAQAAIAAREAHRRANADVAEQTGLRFAKGLDNTRVLRDVRCYPNPRTAAAGRGAAAAKQSIGSVEVHENGLRFVQKTDEPVVVLFSNIAKAIFQPADNDQRIVFHLHLKQNIMVGKKKTKDVQFYLDVMDDFEGVAARHGGASWEDEVAEEEAERQRTARLNSEFLHFAKGFEKVFGEPVCVPIRKFHFFGTHDKGMVKFKGSDKVLFSLTEAPPFVEEMDNVEIVVFERVTPMKTSFDVTFIRPDYSYRAINNIEYKFLDRIKDWLNEAKAKYYEVGVNLVWRTVLKEVKADGDWDPWGDDGWHAILAESDDENDSSDDAESDSSFVMSASESGSSSESESDYVSSESSAYSESSGSDDDDGSSEEGLDWDELEERAAKDDRKRGNVSDDEGKRKRRR